MAQLHRPSSHGAAPPQGPAQGPTAGEIGREVLRVGLTLSAAALVLGLLAVAMGSA